MFATLIARVTSILRFFSNREIREINVSRKFSVIRQFTNIENTKEIIINHKGTRMVKDGED